MQPMLKASASMAKKKNAKIEFPTSPQLSFGEEITHYTHSEHPLVKVNLRELFTCNGCKEYGSGKRYACRRCDYQLHEFCAKAPPQLQNHPLHGQHQLVFHARSKKGGMSWPKCDVCHKSTRGFTFRCKACSFQMHPCCAMLSNEINSSVHLHTLKLLPPSSSGTDPGITCGECKKKRSGRVYRCTVCDYHLHAFCAKNLINGLQSNGIPPPEKSSMIGKTARLASQVVTEFIEGLIEGFGEGMGEYLVQNIARGGRGRRSRAVDNN